jgi:regulator of sigma E protease
LKRTLLDIRRPFVIGAVTDESTNKFTSQRCCSYLNGQAAKYIDQAKAILENNKGKPFLQRYCAIKREKNPSYN